MKEIEGSRRPCISDIAAEAGVSIATVSRVINASAYVKPDVASAVRHAIDRLGYVRLRIRSSDEPLPLVGLMLPDIENPFFAGLIKGVQSAADTRGFDVMLVDSGNDPLAVPERLDRLSARRVQAALVVAPAGFNASDAVLSLQGPRGYSAPVVFMDRKVGSENAHFVGSENYHGAYNAAVYLASMGHRDVLYLAGDCGLSTESERHAGFMAGMATAGITNLDYAKDEPPRSTRFFEPCGFSLDAAYRAVKTRLSAGLDFSAIFAADDYMAYGALNALREAGLRVPEDVSLVGFDDLPFSSMIGLTTVKQQAFELGVAALALAIDLAHGRRHGPQSVILSTSLIIRGSCAINARSMP
ncbi:MAG TPA: LacI family DNA-binding transcriptional regulator [bacterium]|nr:LacI family DNA-binding transcriptional regulator [bacterium]